VVLAGDRVSRNHAIVQSLDTGQSNLRFRQPAVAIPADPAGYGTSDMQSTNTHYTERLITVLVVDIRDYTASVPRPASEYFHCMV
jgi:hypothetical protein